MAVKIWQLMLSAFFGLIIVSVLGGLAYHFLESGYEKEQADAFSAQLNDFLARRPCIDQSDVRTVYDLVQLARPGGVRIGVTGDDPIQNTTNWDVISSMFLAFQVVGAVGYGNSPPQTTGGRVFCVFFTLFGLPLFVAAAMGVGDLLTIVASAIRRFLVVRVCRRPASSVDPALTSTSPNWMRRKLSDAFVLFLFGSIVFILIPAAAFKALETWTFGEAIYCAIITTMTIGFADFVPGALAPDSYRLWYRLLVGFWIMGTLYWFAGVLQCVRKAFRFDEEVQKSLQQTVHDAQLADQDQSHLDKNSNKKKKPEKQRKSASGPHRQHLQQVPSMQQLDVHALYAPSRLYPAFVNNAYDSGSPAVITPTVLPPGSAAPANHISRVTVGN